MKEKKQKEIKEDNYSFDFEMSANISLEEPLRIGRIPSPFGGERICPECGHQIIGGASYICSNCGYSHFSTFSDFIISSLKKHQSFSLFRIFKRNRYQIEGKKYESLQKRVKVIKNDISLFKM